MKVRVGVRVRACMEESGGRGLFPGDVREPSIFSAIAFGARGLSQPLNAD